MKQRVADYVAEFLVTHGIKQIFSVVGGGAMHLNNAFALEERLNKIYNHHEQACAIAAESYSRINNEVAAVCVTSGPGGTNALTGVLCAWQDSLPLIVLSGQVRYDITVESTGLNLRQFGEQEYYIVRSVAPMTKYAVMINDARTVKYHLSKALYLATTGRRGPVWLDIPLNIQGQIIDTEELTDYVPPTCPAISPEIADKIKGELEHSQRPVLIAGSAVRTAGALGLLTQFAAKNNIPVVCPTSTVDYFTPNDDFYFGMFGTFGSRAGNFIVQNADLIISLGARLSFKQIGFNYQSFSPHSRKIIVDADPEELKKTTIKPELTICADVKDVLNLLHQINVNYHNNNWWEYCRFLKQKFVADGFNNASKSITTKQFCHEFFQAADENTIVVLGNNTAAVSMLQHGIIKHGQRMYGNVNCGTMGYDLPAAIGATMAADREVYCATGEGSMQMNLQELQTIAHNNLPVKVIVFNNNKYQAIVQTHKNFFGGVLPGCTNDSGISFPPLNKIADVYGFTHKKISTAAEIKDAVKWLIRQPNRAILELIQSEQDVIMPKLSSKRLNTGEIISPPLDDLFPFLSPDEYDACCYVNFNAKGSDI